MPLCGGENILKDAPVLAPQISIETLFAKEPAAIIYAAEKMAQTRHRGSGIAGSVRKNAGTYSVFHLIPCCVRDRK
jgi:hypothetical protein